MPLVSPAPDLATRLGAIQLPEAAGTKVLLKTLWERHTVILVHLRHFG